MSPRNWLKAWLADGIKQAKDDSGLIDRKAESILEKVGDGLIDQLAVRLPILDLDFPILDDDHQAEFKLRLMEDTGFF